MDQVREALRQRAERPEEEEPPPPPPPVSEEDEADQADSDD
jgi:hypothetical protein